MLPPWDIIVLLEEVQQYNAVQYNAVPTRQEHVRNIFLYSPLNLVLVEREREREKEKGRKGQWAVYYTSPQSFIVRFF